MKMMAMFAAMSIMAFGMPVLGETAFSNYWDITEPEAVYTAWNYTSPSPEIVEPFTTAANSLGWWELTEIKLNGYGGGLLGGGSSPAVVTIYEDSAVLASFAVDIDTSMGEDFSFAVSDITLAGSANYLFGVEATGNNAVGWRETLGNDDADHVFELSGNPVPEPATLSLLAVGGLALLRRKRR